MLRIISTVAALVAVLVALPAATAASNGAKPAKCVRAWNADPNSGAQKQLRHIFGDGGAGNVIVGSDDGACVLAAYNVNKPNYLVFTRSGNEFSKTGKGPGDEFDDYRSSINSLDVIVQPSGTVKPAGT